MSMRRISISVGAEPVQGAGEGSLAAQRETDAGDRRELTLSGSARAAYGWLSHLQ